MIIAQQNTGNLHNTPCKYGDTTKSDDPNSDYQRALTSRQLIYGGESPELIDEWQSIEQVWDDVRTMCDEDGQPGKFILTGSSVPVNPEKIFHSGAGRIHKLKMYTMSLYESGDSEGTVSLTDLFENKQVQTNMSKKPTLEALTDVIVRGGWPASLMRFAEKCDIKPKFLCVVNGLIDYAYRRADGVYVVPIGCLKP